MQTSSASKGAADGGVTPKSQLAASLARIAATSKLAFLPDARNQPGEGKTKQSLVSNFLPRKNDEVRCDGIHDFNLTVA